MQLIMRDDVSRRTWYPPPIMPRPRNGSSTDNVAEMNSRCKWRPTNLSQGSLQIEADIRRLRRLDRPVHGKDAAPEHVIRRTIDGLHTDELPGFVAKCRKRSPPAIAPHHDAIISGGQARDLKLVLALIAPEPRQTIIGLCVAGQPRGNAARVIGGVLHGFQPQRPAEARAYEQRAIADRGDIRIRREQLLVDDDSGRHW